MKRTFSFGQLEDLIQDALVLIQKDEFTTPDAIAKVVKGNKVTYFADVAYIQRGVNHWPNRLSSDHFGATKG